MHDKRLEKAKGVITMISMLPISVWEKAELVSLKTAGARYGLESTQPNPKMAKAFDEQIMDVIGGKQNNGCKQATMAPKTSSLT